MGDRLSARTELVNRNGVGKNKDDENSDNFSGNGGLVPSSYYRNFDRLELEGFYETPEYPERCECDLNHGCHDVTSYKKCIPEKSDYFEYNEYTTYKSRMKKMQ